MRLNYPRNHAMMSLRNAARNLSLLSALGAAAACELPTDTPKLEQDWIFPLTTLDVSVEEFLPSDVTIDRDTTKFIFDVEGVDFDRTLGDLCDGCQGLDGLTVPKPAFQNTFDETFPLPDDVEGVTVEDGEVEIIARNGFGFDPLRPPGGADGSVTLALRDGGPTGTVLDQIVLDGSDTSFGPGATIVRTLSYSGPIGNELSVTVAILSPAGGPEPGNWVPIQLADRLQVEVNPGTVEASAALISVGGRSFELPATELDVEDLDDDLIDRIERGTMRLLVDNPWSVGGTLNMVINGPAQSGPLNFIALVPASPNATVEVAFSKEDLQEFLGEPGGVFGGQGTVAQGSGSIQITPKQFMTIETELGISVIIG